MLLTVLAVRLDACWCCKRLIRNCSPIRTLKLQDEVAGTENRIATARKDYNDGVQDYNTTRARFPTVISAKLFGFKEEPYFKAEEGASQAPTINANSLRQPTP